MRQSLFNAASYLAVWVGLYFAAAVVALAQVAGAWPPVEGRRGAWGEAIGLAFCVGMGVYLLDRVKLSDRLLDPADAAAHPERAGFVARHARAIRVLIAALAVVGMALGAVISWVLVPLVVAAHAGVMLYGGRARRGRARPKDVLVVKNAYVAAAITGFAAVVVGAAQGWVLAWGAAVFSAGLLFVRVMADSVICDVEDEHADRRFATSTLVTRLGPGAAWNIASAARIAVGLALALIPVGAREASIAWGIVTILSTIALRAARPRRLRAWTDLRFPLEAVAVSLVLMVW